MDTKRLEEIIIFLQAQNEELVKRDAELVSQNRKLLRGRAAQRVRRNLMEFGHKHTPYLFKQADKVIEVLPEEERCKCGGIFKCNRRI
jgi:thioesterase domain-containing protein